MVRDGQGWSGMKWNAGFSRVVPTLVIVNHALHLEDSVFLEAGRAKQQKLISYGSVSD